MCNINLVYSSCPLIGLVEDVSLLITLPGASESKDQVIPPLSGVGAWFPVTLEFIQDSQRLLGSSRGHSGLLQERSLDQFWSLA